jgi:hypothetical protein
MKPIILPYAFRPDENAPLNKRSFVQAYTTIQYHTIYHYTTRSDEDIYTYFPRDDVSLNQSAMYCTIFTSVMLGQATAVFTHSSCLEKKVESAYASMLVLSI